MRLGKDGTHWTKTCELRCLYSSAVEIDPSNPRHTERSGFYETVTEVNGCLRFSLLGKVFVRCSHCKACCSPPCFYLHFMWPLWLGAGCSVGEVDVASFRPA